MSALGVLWECTTIASGVQNIIYMVEPGWCRGGTRSRAGLCYTLLNCASWSHGGMVCRRDSDAARGAARGPSASSMSAAAAAAQAGSSAQGSAPNSGAGSGLRTVVTAQAKANPKVRQELT